MGELPKKEWMESVQLVFDYFCERTPRSFVEARDTSVVWNYKYAGQPGTPFSHPWNPRFAVRESVCYMAPHYS